MAQKPIAWRFELIQELQNTMRKLAEQRIRQTQPEISNADLTAEIFKAYYSQEFSEQEQTIIMENIRQYHKMKEQIYKLLIIR